MDYESHGVVDRFNKFLPRNLNLPYVQSPVAWDPENN